MRAIATAATAADAAATEAKHLYETARDVRDLLYYLSDPRGFQYDYYQTVGAISNDPIVGPLAQNLVDLYRHRTLEAKVTAQAMADTATPATVAIGAGVTWDAPLCRLFEAQGSAQGFYDEGVDSALAWGVGGCLPLPFDTFELGYRGRRQVRRSLLAAPIAVGDRDSGSTVYANLRFYRWLSANHQIDVAPISMQFDWTRAGATVFQAWFSTAPVYWARRGRGLGGRDQTFDFVRIRYASLGVDDGAYDPGVLTISPLAISGVAIGDHLDLGLDLGFETGEWQTDATSAVQRKTFHLDATVRAAAGPGTIEVHAVRALAPTIADQILDEQRLTGRLDVDRAAAWLRLDGFASHARLLGLGRTSDRVWTYGVGADATLAITDHLFLYARVEGARNIAVDDTAAVPATQRDLRATGGVTAELRRPL